jgi:hypothetical protein
MAEPTAPVPTPEPAPAPKKSNSIHVKLVRAVWDKDGNRIDEGTIVEMTKDEAFESIESGALVRATPEEIEASKGA